MRWGMEKGTPLPMLSKEGFQDDHWGDLTRAPWSLGSAGLMGKAVNQNRRQGSPTGTKQEWSRVSYRPMNGTASSGTSLKGTLRTRITLPHESPLQSPREGASRNTEVLESKSKHGIAAELRGWDHDSTSCLLLIFSASWDNFRKVRNSKGGERISKKKLTTSPSVTTGFQSK